MARAAVPRAPNARRARHRIGNRPSEGDSRTGDAAIFRPNRGWGAMPRQVDFGLPAVPASRQLTELTLCRALLNFTYTDRGHVTLSSRLRLR